MSNKKQYSLEKEPIIYDKRAFSSDLQNTKKWDGLFRLRINNHVDILICNKSYLATVYKGNIIKNLIMDCQSYTKYRPNETTGGIFVSWRRKEELPTGA